MYAIEAESIVNDLREENVSLETFLENLSVNIISYSPDKLELDLLNSHPSLSNALRRIMISEVPTIAFHNISISENNTVFPDEYIAHRIGLIPIVVDPELFDFKKDDDDTSNVLNFRIHYKNNSKENECVYSDSIEWIPNENQKNINLTIKPGVLICKSVPGNIIEMELQAEKGIGKTHAKWSPVSICSYKIMPKIVLLEDFYGDDAIELQKCFSKDVIEIENGKAVVKNPRLDIISREVFRHEKFKNSVQIFREDGWYCFTIESIALDPLYIFKAALKVLVEKCRVLKENIVQLYEE